MHDTEKLWSKIVINLGEMSHVEPLDFGKGNLNVTYFLFFVHFFQNNYNKHPHCSEVYKHVDPEKRKTHVTTHTRKHHDTCS